MDNPYNIQQLRVLDNRQNFTNWITTKQIKLLNEIEQSFDDTIIWKLQAENNIWLQYTPMEEPIECNGQEDNNFVFYHGTGEQDDQIQID